MDSKPVAQLIEHPWPMVLVPWSSGVVFRVQCGGRGCYQLDLEGVCLPLVNGERLNRELTALHPGCAQPISLIEANLLDEILHDVHGDSLMTIDRDRLSESYEAWVHVIIQAQWDEVLRDFRGRRAILTWQNCD